MKKIKLAVVGASGVVGRTMLDVLTQRNFPYESLTLFASSRSAGSTITVGGVDHIIVELTPENIAKHPCQIAIFSAGGTVSKEFAPLFAAQGTVVVDNSSFWRMNPDVPLIVPEVNAQDIFKHKNIIANPNCSTIEAVVALKPLHDAFKIRRIVYSTYQAVSGAGSAGISELENGINGTSPKKFPYQIFGNILPHIDLFLENGNTKEEQKMIDETRKILGVADMRISATCARVPVINCHSESINVEFEMPFTLDKVKSILNNAQGVVVCDDPNNLQYPMPITANGRDEVFVGRLRVDSSAPNCLNMWVVADNLRKGAATNAVQIAEIIAKNL